VRTFYHLFFGYLARSGMDEVSDDDVICPPGYVPLMTIHQAKGLEFPFVFVGHLSESPSTGEAHALESEMAKFPGNPKRTFKLAAPQVRAELDRIRQFYVAYSRAQYALILVGTKSQVANAKGTAVPCGPTKGWLTQRLINL
jgi:DNA helicase II / ATP-dependent DNA helicase PcrA